MKIVFSLFLVFLVSSAYAVPYGYEHKKDVTINHLMVEGTNDHIDFPVLLKFTDPDLRSVSNGGKVYSESGYDIVFTLDNCMVALDHEVESYNPVNGAIVIWVKIPTLYATTNTSFSMYYGNPATLSSTSTVSTWSSFYESVLHLHENPSGAAPQMNDASGKGHSGSAQGGMNAANQVSGIAGTALSFDEVNDHIMINDFDYASTKSFSISMWFRMTDNNGNSYQYLFSHGAYGTFNSMNCYVGENALGITADQNMLKTIFQDANDATSTNGLDAGNNYHDGQWHYYVFTVNELGNPTVYLDGVEKANISFNGGQTYDPTTNIFIGGRSDLNGTRFWGGELDEMRLLNDTISHEWIVTEYNNMIHSGAFFSIGPETSPALGCAPLPFGIFDFTARQKTDHVALSFAISNGMEVESIMIERSSDLEHWIPLQTIDHGIEQTFHGVMLDQNPSAGNNYYRMVLHHKDQSQEISHVQLVSFETDLYLNHYPNPVQDILTIEFRGAAGLYHFSVVDLRGVSVLTVETEFSKGSHLFNMPVSMLANGVYYLQTLSPDGKVYNSLLCK